MNKQFLALAVCLLAGLQAANAAESRTFSANQLVSIDAQLTGQNQDFIMSSIAKKVDFLKQDQAQISDYTRCKNDFMPYGNAYLSLCDLKLRTAYSTFNVHARLIAKGTKKGLAEQARYGTAMPTELEIKFMGFCRSPHLTVTNALNNQVVLSEASSDCSMVTTDIN